MIFPLMMKPLLLAIAATAIACAPDAQSSADGEVASQPDRELAQAIEQDNALASAQAALNKGHPWQATQIMARVLRDPKKRSPAALLLAARAAAGWEGWAEVEKLLGRQPWLDAQFDGEGRELLTRASLERGGDTAAVTQALAGLRTAKGAEQRAVRTVLLARALERSNHFDSAAALYTRAATTLVPVRDWLALRAAGTTADSADRARAFARVRAPIAKARIPWTDAQARERTQDALGSAARYASLGATVIALRLRLSVATDIAGRNALKDELLAFIRTHNGSADSRAAVEVLDRGFTSFSPEEEIVMARSLAVSGPPARAITAFERALAQPSLLTPADRLAYAQVLVRVNRSRDALAQLAQVDGPLAPQAAYQRARVLLSSGTADQTRAALRDVIARFPNDTASASAALYLLADLSTDDGNDTQARSLFRQLYRSYPTSSRASEARFHAAIIALVAGDSRGAAVELDSLASLYPRSEDAAAARYWGGRAYAASGNDSLARMRWRESMGQNVSYYANRAALRLGQQTWVPPARPDTFARFADIDSALARMAILDRLGMDVEARFELDGLEESAAASPERLASTAHAFLEHGQSSRAIRLAQKLVESGQRDARAYRLLYPIVDRDELTRAAKANGLDPWLVAGLIRQESNFNPRAVSAANARGLMQVLPSVGEEVARGLGYPVWYPALLLDPDANLQLGTAHLAAYMKQYGPLPRVLAAYNAGGSRVSRWSNKSGMGDPEMFAERIPFAETRDYVRIVQRNAEAYKNLYDWRR